MACSAPTISYFRILRDLPRLLALLISIGCLVLGVITEGFQDVAPRLIPIGAVLMLVTVVWPAITTAELGHPSLGKIALSTTVRRERLRASCEQQRHDLEICAAEVWGDPQSSPELVEFAVEQAVFHWRGSADDHLLHGFMLCLMVQEAHRWVLSRRPPEPQTIGGGSHLSRQMAKLSIHQRGLFLLSSRERLSAEAIATMMDRTVEEIRTELTQIQDTLTAGEPR